MTKHCRKCLEDKPLACFSKASKEPDGYQFWCKQCAADYFQVNRTRILPQIKERQERVRAEARQFAWNYLLGNPCIDCGESDPVVLDFDHVRGQKHHNTSAMVNSWGMGPSLLQEMGKCEVRCANCHRRKTAQERGYYAWLDNEGSYANGRAASLKN